MIEHSANYMIFKEFSDFVVDVTTIKRFALHQDLEGADIFVVPIETEGNIAQLVDGTQEGETLIL